MTAQGDHIRRIVQEELNDLAHRDEGDVALAAKLTEITLRLTSIEKNTAEMAARQATANHRTEKLEVENVRQEAKREERDKWEHKAHQQNLERIGNVYKVMGIALTAAGVISGIVFYSLDKISP